MVASTLSAARRDRVVVILDALAVGATARGVARLRRVWDGLHNEADIEAVHRLRTGLNRIRSLVRLAGPVCGWPNVAPTERALRRWQRALGPLRDLDVLSADLVEVTDSLHGPSRRVARRLVSILQARRRAQYAKALRDVQRKKGKQAFQALERLHETLVQRRRGVNRELAAMDKGRRPRVYPAIALLWPEVYSLWMARKRRAEQTFHGIVLHRFRLANKRLRHVLQLFQKAAPKRLQPVYGVVDELHESLGRLHDFEVLIGEAETLAAKQMARAGRLGTQTPAGCIGLLTALEARRREIFDHVLGLWEQIHDPAIAEMLAFPVTSLRSTPART